MVVLDRIILEMTMLRESWGSAYCRKDSENWLRWFGHVERRLVDFEVRSIYMMGSSQIIR